MLVTTIDDVWFVLVCLLLLLSTKSTKIKNVDAVIPALFFTHIESNTTLNNAFTPFFYMTVGSDLKKMFLTR